MEHESICSTVVAALSDIADSLPWIEVSMRLYPAGPMKQAVAFLYAHIVRFLIRALKWYDEGRVTRAFHSITKPVSLYYKDIIEKIQRDRQNLLSHAVTCSQVEQRDVHIEVRELRSVVDNAISTHHAEQVLIREKLSTLSAVMSQLRSAMISQSLKADQKISVQSDYGDFQTTHAPALLSAGYCIDHQSDLKTSLFLRDRRRRTPRSSGVASFWTSGELRRWNTTAHSSAIALAATFREQVELRDFCADVIEQLVGAQVAVLWVIGRRDAEVSQIERLKSLVFQALCLDKGPGARMEYAIQLQRFLSAKSDSDLADMLGDLIQHFQLVYIVCDTTAVDANATVHLTGCLQQVLDRLSDQGVQTIVKMITTLCGPGMRSFHQPAVATVLRSRKKSKKPMKKTAMRKLPGRQDFQT